MRRIGVAITTAVLAAGLAACGPASSVKSSPDKATAAVTTTKAKPKAAPAKAKPAAAHIGDTITVHGLDSGAKVAVTLVKWVDPAKGADEFTTPDSGKRFVAAQIRVTNTGTAVYEDTPGNGMQVADGDGQRFDSDFSEVSAGPSMASEVKLSPGDKALGYISFQVPKASKVAKVQFAMDSGFSDETGEWTIR